MARGTGLLRSLRAAGLGRVGGGVRGAEPSRSLLGTFLRLAGSAEAYESLLRASCRAALARSHPSPARAAHGLYAEMGSLGLALPPAAASQLLLACARTKQAAQAKEVFERVAPEAGHAAEEAEEAEEAAAVEVEPAALRAFALMLSASPGGEPCDASLVRRLLAAHGRALAERLVGGAGDREHGAALVQLCASCGLAEQGCGRRAGPTLSPHPRPFLDLSWNLPAGAA